MSPVTILDLEWDHRYVAIFRCFREDGVYQVDELKIAGKRAIKSDSDLQRVLEALQRDLIAKRIYKYANNPTTRLLIFKPPKDEQENQGRQHLNDLLQAKNIRQVRTQANALANRYKDTPNIRPGVLIFLVSKGVLDQHMTRNCVFVFKCDFEDVSQVTQKELFRKVQNAIVERTKKGALCPYFHQSKFDDTTIRVFDERGETDYWLKFLGLGERAPAHVSSHEAVMAVIPKRLKKKYEKHFENLPPARSMVSNERPIAREDRLPTREIQKLSVKSKQTTSLSLGQVRTTAPVNQYGWSWILAEETGQSYILIKGPKLEIHTKAATPIDLANLPSLEQALEELGISLP